MGVGLAIGLGAAAIGGAATGCAASESAGATEEAARQNRKAAREANELRERLFHETRGSEGTAVLPEYQREIERQLSAAAGSLYGELQGAMGTPAEQLARGGAIREEFAPVFQRGSDLIGDIYSGALTRERLGEAVPVATARANVATASRAAIMDGLRRQLNEIKAQQQLAGFSQSGSTAQGALLRSSLGPLQAANQAQAQAALQNAVERQQIQESGRQLALSSMDLPLARARQKAQLERLPSEFAAGNFEQSLQPLRFFYIGPGQAPTVQNPPLVSAVPGAGQIAAAGFGQFASNLGNLALTQYAANQMPQSGQGWTYMPASQQAARLGQSTNQWGYNTAPAGW